MKIAFIALAVFALLMGCSAPYEATTSDMELEAVKIVPLPALKSFMSPDKIRLSLFLHILRDGTVESLKMVGTSGDPEWDSIACQSIKQWRFSVPRRNGVPVETWAKKVLVVKVSEPMVMTLGRLDASNQAEADSLYVLVEEGAIADSSFRQTLETLDIAAYPKRVREELQRLDVNEVSRPLRLGHTFVIFKRFQSVTTGGLPN